MICTVLSKGEERSEVNFQFTGLFAQTNFPPRAVPGAGKNGKNQLLRHFSIRLRIWAVSLALSLLVLPRRVLTRARRSSAADTSSL